MNYLTELLRIRDDEGTTGWARETAKSILALKDRFESKEITADSVFAQHGWTVSSANDTPNHLDDPLATNINQTIETKHSDPISGSIPLRSSWCNIRKI